MELEASYKRMDELLQTADVISIHTPLTEETRHLIGYRELSMMKPGAYLINTSRVLLLMKRLWLNACPKAELPEQAWTFLKMNRKFHLSC